MSNGWWWTTPKDLEPLRTEIVLLRDEIVAQNATINQLVMLFKQIGGEMMADLSRLTNEVTRNTDAQASAVTMIQGLADQVKANSSDQAAVDALADQIRSNADSLAAAVVANTPVQPQSQRVAAPGQPSRPGQARPEQP